MVSNFIPETFIPGLDILSTFFTIAYLGWLLSREIRSTWSLYGGDTQYWSGDHGIKRSLLNQHICR